MSMRFQAFFDCATFWTHSRVKTRQNTSKSCVFAPHFTRRANRVKGASLLGFIGFLIGSSGRTRTYNPSVNSRMLAFCRAVTQPPCRDLGRYEVRVANEYAIAKAPHPFKLLESMQT